MAFFTQDYLEFFKELAPNNTKDWFDINRKRYESSVKKPFQEFIQHLISAFEKHDSRLKDLEPSTCIFRINRDIRFAKDKSPYKLFCSAVVAPNGKKSDAVNGIYFECGPEALRVYGGAYELDKNNILAVREGIASQLIAFNQLITAKEFVDIFGELRGEKNKIIPAELKTAAEKQPLIFNKQWYFMAEFPAETITSEELANVLEKCYLVGKPIENFFNQFIQRH